MLDSSISVKLMKLRKPTMNQQYRLSMGFSFRSMGFSMCFPCFFSIRPKLPAAILSAGTEAFQPPGFQLRHLGEHEQRRPSNGDMMGLSMDLRMGFGWI